MNLQPSLVAGRLAVSAGLAAVLLGSAPTTPGQVTWRRHIGITATENFGYTLAGAGDEDADGFAEYAVGAPNAATGGNFSGRVDVYSGATGALRFSFSGGAGERLGFSLAGGLDLTGDGVPDLAAGGTGTLSAAPRVEIRSGATGLLAGVVSSTFPGFGQNLLLADLDGQGTAEVIVLAPGAGIAAVYGGNGTLIGTFASPVSGGWLGIFGGVAGDVDGDGWKDVVLAFGPGTASAGIFSGATGFLIRALAYPGATASQNTTIACPGDLDGDGAGDVVLQLYPASGQSPAGQADVVAFSGATGAVLWFTPRDYGIGLGNVIPSRVAPFDDVNFDGVPDVAYGARSCCYGQAGLVIVLSGADGSVQGAVGGGGTFFSSHIAAAGDIDGDGRQDLLEGEFDANQATLLPRASVIVTRIRPTTEASSTMLGRACVPGPNWPVFRTDFVPRLGTTVTLQLSRAPAGPGLLAAAAGWPVPQLFPGPCIVWPDLAVVGSWSLLSLSVSASGTWSLPIAIPAALALAGTPFTLQIGLPTAAGTLLTGGVLAILGT